MASKDSNALVIWLSIFVLLTVIFGVMWYMTYADAAKLRSDVAANQKTTSSLEESTRQANADKLSLLTAIAAAPATADANQVVTDGKTRIAALAGNGTTIPDTFMGAVEELASTRNAANTNAADRQVQLQQKITELDEALKRHMNDQESLQVALKSKEDELLAKERVHAEELGKRDKTIDELKAERNSIQSAFSDYREEKEREVTTLREEIAAQRDTLKKLRAAKFSLENINFERPAGRLVSVDQNSLTATVDLGSRDNVRVGTTFSVYTINNSGVGLSQSDKDLKGKIVITEILGPSQAKADLVDQKIGQPMGEGDPIYSPIFSPGQAMEIAVVGGLDFDGNPGSDRDEFRRIVKSNGASIVLEVDDEARIIGRNGEEIAESDIRNGISSTTRFVLIGDLGDENTQDTIQKELNNKTRALKVKLEEAATDNGVYILSLSRFLDYIGYSRKSLSWTATKPFPATLPNGAKSSTVDAAFGRRHSSAAISGAFSGRKTRPLVSTGSTSALYEGTNRAE